MEDKKIITQETKTESPLLFQPAIVPEEESNRENVVAMYNGTVTNELTTISTSQTEFKVDKITNSATAETGKIKVFLDNFSTIGTGGLRISTIKLFDLFTLFLSQKNTYKEENTKKIQRSFTIPLTYYMDVCKINNTKPNRDKTRSKIKENLNILYNMSVEWTEKSKEKQKDFKKTRICDEIGIKKGNIIFSFTSNIAEYLINAYVMDYNLKLLQLDERQPTAYMLGKKLLYHNSIYNNVVKHTSNIISVKSLLNVCKNTIPSYEEVMLSDRMIGRRIKEALEKYLNILHDDINLITWEYCNSKGIKCTDEQLATTDYKTFSELYIYYEIIGAIDPIERIKKIEKNKSVKDNQDKKKKKKYTRKKIQ